MAARRARGDGSITLREDGRWHGRADLGLDENGRRNRRSVYGATQAEVAAKLRDLRRQAETGTLTRTGSRTVTLTDLGGIYRTHLDARVRNGNLAASTADWYARLFKVHVVETHGKVRVADLTASMVERWVTEPERSGSTRRGIYLALHQALDLALRDGIVSVNVAAKVKGPRADSTSPEAAGEHDVELLLKAARDLADVPNSKCRMETPIMVLAWTGMRRVELLALRWRDISPTELRITRSKTKKGIRTVPLARPLAEYLRAVRGAEDAYVVPQEDDPTRPRDPRAFNRSFERVADRAGVEVSPHQLRHGLATRLVLAGTPLPVVKAILGHASLRTLDVYAHSNTTSERAALDALVLGS